MSNSVATRTEGRGSGSSPRWFPILSALVIALVVGLLVGRFVFYSDTATVPQPTVVVPPDDAVLALQTAAEQTPDNAQAWTDLGLAATGQAIATSNPTWYAIATDAFDRAAALAPDDAFITIARGQLELSLHDFDRALDLGLQATTDLPDTADGYGILVDAQVELGMYDDAPTTLQRMLDLRPDLTALARASYLRQLNGDLDGAIVAMRQAETAGGGSAGASALSGGSLTSRSAVAGLLGDLLLQRGDIDEAQQAYERAQTPAAGAGLARIAAARGELSRAVQILEELSTENPFPAVITALAEMQTRAGDDAGLAETVELGRTIAMLQQGAGQTVDLELALFEASYGDPDVAVELAMSSYDARPDNVFAEGALAWALHQSGRTEDARDLAEQATRLGTVDAAHELRMAEILGQESPDVLDRNPLATDLFLP